VIEHASQVLVFYLGVKSYEQLTSMWKLSSIYFPRAIEALELLSCLESRHSDSLWKFLKLFELVELENWEFDMVVLVLRDCK